MERKDEYGEWRTEEDLFAGQMSIEAEILWSTMFAAEEFVRKVADGAFKECERVEWEHPNRPRKPRDGGWVWYVPFNPRGVDSLLNLVCLAACRSMQANGVVGLAKVTTLMKINSYYGATLAANDALIN